jgi:rhomboid family GlyGly-CTERM serine protease
MVAPALKTADTSPGRAPWAALAVSLLAVSLWFWPRGSAWLVYERERVLAGEWWRLLTGHGVHWSANHLGWNLAVFLPAGIWAERSAPASARWFLALAPAVIGVVLLVGDPALVRYAGLSGIVNGMLTLLALEKLAEATADRWLWHGVLALLLLKIAIEFWVGQPLFVRAGESGFQPVPLAHLAGIVCAVTVHRARRW